jgi:putative ABC transport system permease protein
MLFEIAKMSFESLMAKKTRSFLSMLGIIIGVSTVIAVFAIGQGAKDAVDKQFAGLSAKSIMVMGNMGRGATASSKLSTADAVTIANEASYVEQVVGSIQGSSNISFNGQSSSATVIGASDGYFSVSNLEFSDGQAFSAEDITNEKKVAVLGYGLLDDLYIEDSAAAIGQTITINKKKFEIVGILKEKGTSMGPMRIDDSIIMPDTTAKKNVLGTGGQVMLNIQVDSVDNVDAATEEVTAVLREAHKLAITAEDDFRLMDAGSMVESAQESADLMSFLLTAIATITLLVSGIGIMNVMFVTVAERTKEIGIAKAIGGKQGDILLQFLLESIILSTIGGLIGIVIGQAAIPILSNLDIVLMSSSVTGPIIGFTFSVTVGVFFGFYPAYKASKLDPVDALRSE